MSIAATARSVFLSPDVGRPNEAAQPGLERQEDCESTDEALLSRVLHGDAEALGSLYRRYAKLAHSIGRRILRDEAEAEDLVQDVFLYIHRKCGVFDQLKGTAKSWIVQTIYYQALQRRMRLTARHYYASEELDGRVQAVSSAANFTQDDHSSEVVFGKSKWREILATLTEDQWETLRLHFFEGYTLAEIAQKRCQTVGNTRHHFYRGLEALKNQVFPAEISRREKQNAK